MKISIGSDHAGYDLRMDLLDHLRAQGHAVLDRGAPSKDSVDYPDFAEAVARDVVEGRAERGVLICATGIGISIAANKIRGIRAALVHNEDAARLCRLHNNANIICFGQRHTTSVEGRIYCDLFLGQDFEGGRHARRVDKIAGLEQSLL